MIQLFSSSARAVNKCDSLAVAMYIVGRFIYRSILRPKFKWNSTHANTLIFACIFEILLLSKLDSDERLDDLGRLSQKVLLGSNFRLSPSQSGSVCDFSWQRFAFRHLGVSG